MLIEFLAEPEGWAKFGAPVRHSVVSVVARVRPIGSSRTPRGLPNERWIMVRKGSFGRSVLPTALRRGGPGVEFGQRHNAVGLTLGTCGHHEEFALSFELVSVRAARLTRPLNVTNPRAN